MGTEMDTGWGRGCHRATKCLPVSPPRVPNVQRNDCETWGCCTPPPRTSPFSVSAHPRGPSRTTTSPSYNAVTSPCPPRCPQIPPPELHVPLPCPRRCPRAASHPHALPLGLAHHRGQRGQPPPAHRGRPLQNPRRLRGRIPAALSPPDAPRGIGAAPGRAGSPPKLNPWCLVACPVLSPTPGDTFRNRLTGWQDPRGGNPAGKGNGGASRPYFQPGRVQPNLQNPIRTPKCCWMLHGGGLPRF